MRLNILASMLPRFLAFMLIALCSLPLASFAQYFTIGTDPASVHWNQISTEHFRLIYPDSMESKAQYIANAFEYAYKPVTSTYEVNPRKWPVILHNHSVVSNAFTPYAPKRMDILTTSPQDNYAQDWFDQLILHEFRHSTQYTIIDRGLTRALSYVFGQQSVPGIIGLFVPLWFIEGDAVVTETALSKSGRGRVPVFEMKLKSQFLQKGIYSYDKAANGSFRDFTPDRYELGYQLVGNARKDFGRDVWNNVLKKTGNIPLMLVPFSNTLYKETGYGKSRLYDKITADLKKKWESEDEQLDTTSYKTIAVAKNKAYANYTQAVIKEDGMIIARKSSLDNLVRIVEISPGGIEKVMITPGSMIDGGFSCKGNLVCWAELNRDPRWDLRDYADIKIFDLKTGKLHRLTKMTRYFSPDLSYDGKTVVAVENDLANNNYLVIIDAQDGRLLDRIPAAKGKYLSYPAWSPDGSEIAVIITQKNGKTLSLVNVKTHEWEMLMPFSPTDISKPVFRGEEILFTGAYNGTDNIVAINSITKKLYQVTSSRFGATNASISDDGSTLVYSNYTAGGYRIVTTRLDSNAWQESDPGEQHPYPLADALAAQENFTFREDNVPDSSYAVEPYRKIFHLFNFHSWAPLSVNIDNMNVKPGVTLLSQNLLGTSYTTLGYEYDLNEETGKYMVKYSYEGWYPALDLSMDYGLRKGIHADSTGEQIKYKYHEFNLSWGARVPLNWYARSWLMGFQPYVGYTYKYLKLVPGTNLQFRKDRLNSLDYRLFLYAQSRQSYRDLQPKWGQLAELNFRNMPFDYVQSNSIFSFEMLLYFPGILRHHGISLYGGYQGRSVYDYYYSDLIRFPRGYSGIHTDQVLSTTLDYKFPIFYPDWHIGPIIYFKRLKADIFYDQTWTFDSNKLYNSTGLDLTLDFNLFRLFVPIEAGLRSIYLPQEGKTVFEFLYRVNLTNIY